MRKITWAIWAWTILIVVCIVALDGDPIIKLVSELSGVEAAAKGIVTFGFLWFIGFIILAIIWFMTRPSPKRTNMSAKPGNSGKSFVTTLLLCILLGSLGVHRFYVGKPWTGILMLLTLGGLGIWQLIDTIVIAVQKFKDNKGLPIKAE